MVETNEWRIWQNRWSSISCDHVRVLAPFLFTVHLARMHYVMLNIVILHSSREHPARQKESRFAPQSVLFNPPPQFPPHMPPLPCQLVPPFSVSQRRRVFSLQPRPPPVHRKRRRCIFRRVARGNFGTLTPEAGFWMVGLDTTRPLT